MGFKQYTQCIDAVDYAARTRFITIATLLVGAPAALIVIAMGNPVCLIIVVAIMASAAAVAYYHNWLYNRLICLGGDRDCIGAIVSIGGPTELGVNFFDRDTDYSLNLLLKNANYGPSQDGLSPAEIVAARQVLQFATEQSLPYGELVTRQPSVAAIGMKIGSHFAIDGKPNSNDGHTHQVACVLHAEFEGDGNYKMLLAAKILLAFNIMALVACMFGPLGWLFALATLLFTILALFVTSLLGGFGQGSPSDVNAGELTDNTQFGKGADIVYVQGTWVTDTLHKRWNEIHPIKICMKYGKWDGSWPQDDPGIILRIRKGFEEAKLDVTLANQTRPEHRWQIHPSLDGCIYPGTIL